MLSFRSTQSAGPTSLAHPCLLSKPHNSCWHLLCMWCCVFISKVFVDIALRLLECAVMYNSRSTGCVACNAVTGCRWKLYSLKTPPTSLSLLPPCPPNTHSPSCTTITFVETYCVGDMPCRGGKGKGKALPDHSLHLPDVDTILPLGTALQGLASQQAAAVKAVYLHWCSKRQVLERPLLQRLWYEPPWHRLTVTGKPSTHQLKTCLEQTW